MFPFQIHRPFVVMSFFLLSVLPCNITLIFSSPLPLRAGSMPIISSPLSNLVHVNVIPIHFTTLRMCMSMFRSSHCPGLIVILLSSLLRLSYTFYSSVLCPTIVVVVFHTAHAHVSISVAEPHIINLRFTAYSPALPFTLDRQRSHPPTAPHTDLS